MHLLAEAALAVGAADIATEATELAGRAAEGRFYLTCIGQFKRGKSTLLNALVGAPVLPAGVLPVTAVPTIIRFGPPSARVCLADGTWRPINPDALGSYVTEAANPGNRKGVLAVETFQPSPLLETGLCLVDTPGLGSVFEANAATTREFVPQIDAALVVLGADPPITGDELKLVESVANQVRDLVVVLNKADRTSDAERDEAAGFTRELLRTRTGRDLGPLRSVSALAALTGDTDRSGDWPQLVADIAALAESSAGALAASAARRGLRRLAGRMVRRLDEEIDALERPVLDAGVRLASLEAWSVEAELTAQELGPLLAAHQNRLRQQFEGRRIAALEKMRAAAQQELALALAALDGRPVATLAPRAAVLAQGISRRHVEPWLAVAEADADGAYAHTAARFVDAANELLDRLRRAGAGLLRTLPENVQLPTRLGEHREFHFHDLERLAAPAGFWAGLIAVALPRPLARRRAARRSGALLDRLLEVNAARVESDLNDRVLAARRALETRLRRLVGEARSDAHDAIARAAAAHAEGREHVALALDRLNRIREEVKAQLPGRAGPLDETAGPP